MNLLGSYRKLLDNSKQAMIAAIEIYNKPNFSYREEIVSILLINSWELLFLAILSKNRQRIFKAKARDQNYQTWSFDESIKKAKEYFPSSIDFRVTTENLELLKKYRNNATHYYNHLDNAHCVYVLAQAAIKNYRDLVLEIFQCDIVNYVSLVLLPLSFNEQPDFVQFFRGIQKKNLSPLVQELFQVMKSLEDDHHDTSRLLTQCTVKIESTKKITTADIFVGIDNNNETGTVVLAPPRDPNKTHPYSRKELLIKLKNEGKEINEHSFEAICSEYNLKNTEINGFKYAWKSNRKASAWCYTSEIIKFIRQLTNHDIEQAKLSYKHSRKGLKNE
ncbi:TPA: DUF3644 domain-containing protein [Legionella pneumophila]|uniref:DUF3644 domain-containing protein n=1 Tax=Legionella pneumophila TaxID=446 RepID=UPI00102183D7|nr:DUF3644 domain-containing protein [Legionella pneumophila]RYX03436.1 DUF3644 domain-containing protein [Legionella pneumophila]HCE5420930.1 DUF3644 domain-containing protein [Legionella pneumophila]HCE5625201.1 DUF3644 domain-containing protein [Legionella pneumophila]